MFTNCNSCGALVDLDDHMKCPNCGASLQNTDVEKHKELEYREKLADVKQKELDVLHSAERLKEKQASNNRRYNNPSYNNYQSSRQTYKKKNGGVAKTIAMLFFIVCIFVVLFCYLAVLGIKEEYGSVDNFVNEFQEELNSPTEPEKLEDVKVYVGLNEVAETVNYSVICDGYEEWIYDPNDVFAKYRQPAAGNRFVRFHFIIENTSDSEIYTDEEYVVSADGFQCEKISLTQDAEDSQIQDVRLASGLKTAGYIYREVPIDAKEITLKYGEWVHITFPLEIE